LNAAGMPFSQRSGTSITCESDEIIDCSIVPP
jgi:hypothetical protein